MQFWKNFPPKKESHGHANVLEKELIVTTSFGLQSSVMLHLVLQQSDQIPVVFVDTGYLFPETYEYAQALGQKLGFKEKVYSAMTSPAYKRPATGSFGNREKKG